MSWRRSWSKPPERRNRSASCWGVDTIPSRGSPFCISRNFGGGARREVRRGTSRRVAHQFAVDLGWPRPRYTRPCVPIATGAVATRTMIRSCTAAASSSARRVPQRAFNTTVLRPSPPAPKVPAPSHLTPSEAAAKAVEVPSNRAPPAPLARALGVKDPPVRGYKPTKEEWRRDLLSTSRRLNERKHLYVGEGARGRRGELMRGASTG